MTYQKVYMNQIHSSSLLCQLAQMWREEVLCDAYIRAGNACIKAHRVVLVAACPMLQSMEGSLSGSVLEVKLSSDVHQDSVMVFLQYLYEGFMMLTEDNIREVEKIAGLLQVDSVTKCCIDFHKILLQTTGRVLGTAPRCNFHADQAEFRHVRTSGLLRSSENHGAFKRGYTHDACDDLPYKRARAVANDICNSLPHRNHVGRQTFPAPSRQVVEDSFEIIHTDRDPLKPRIQQSLGVKVASHVESVSDVHVISVPDIDHEPNSYTSPRQSPFTVLNPNKHLAVSSASARKHSPKTISQTLIPIRNQQAKMKHDGLSLFTPVQNKTAESRKVSEQPDQIIIQPISEGDSCSPAQGVKTEESNEKTGLCMASSAQDAGDISIIKVEKGVTPVVAMDTESPGDVDRQAEASLVDDDGEDDYSEGEIYRFADTSGLEGGEEEPGNSWYIDTLKGERNIPPLTHKHKWKPEKIIGKPAFLESVPKQVAIPDACYLNNNYPCMPSTDCEPDDQNVFFRIDDLTEEEHAKIIEILNISNSRQNFAWKLCQLFFSVSELEGCNCYGRKGKKPLDILRVTKIQALSFHYFPLTIVEDYTKAWSHCRIAIDKGIRNIFYDISSVKKMQETAMKA